MLNHRKKKPGRFGTELLVLSSGNVGTNPLTANQTNTFKLPSPTRRARFVRFAASQTTVVADADGTVLARAMKYSGSADAAAAVSADIDLEAATARELQTAGILSTQTDAGIIFDPALGDTLEVNVVNNSAAIDTQPVALVLTCEFELLD